MKIRLVWSRKDHIHRHLVKRLYVRMIGDPEDKTQHQKKKILAINMPKLCTYLGIAAAVTYLSLVTVLYLFLREPSNKRVTWFHVAAPWMWSDARHIIGEESVARGLSCLKTHRYAEAVMQLETGLARAPWKNEGRIELARFYIAAMMPARAIQLLDTGRTYTATDPKAMELVVAAGFFAEDFAFVLRYCDAVKAAAPRAANALLDSEMTARISALIGLERIDEAVALASTVDKPASPAEAEAVIRAFIEAHKYDIALEKIGAALAKNPGDLVILGLKARVRREMKDLPTLVKELNDVASANRANPGAQLLCVKELWRAGLKKEARQALDIFFRYFEANPANLQQAARLVVQLPEPEPLIEACLARAKELGHRPEPLWIAMAEASLFEGNLQGVRPWLEKLRETKNSDALTKQWITIMTNLLAMSDEGTKAYADRLLESLRTLRIPPAVLETIVVSLRDANKPMAAATVANYGRLNFPNNARLAKVAGSLKSLDTQIAQAEAPLAPVPVRLEQKESEFFRKLDELMAAGSLQEASTSIIDLRRQQPEWLGRREKDLLLAEVKIASASEDTLKLQIALRTYLQGDLARRNEAFQFSQKLRAGGKADQEELVLREIYSRYPDDAATRKRLKEIKDAKAQ